jgi:hypothetical protein
MVMDMLTDEILQELSWTMALNKRQEAELETAEMKFSLGMTRMDRIKKIST